MIGVAVIVATQGNAARRRYRIWCDPSYGDYLLSSLQDVTGTRQPEKVTSFSGGNEATV
jgi:hypothetical protein